LRDNRDIWGFYQKWKKMRDFFNFDGVSEEARERMIKMRRKYQNIYDVVECS
jgi:hypothetical protein